jgi:hypothetical protein
MRNKQKTTFFRFEAKKLCRTFRFVPNWDLPIPSLESRNQRGGHTSLRVRGWGSKFGRLEKKPITLTTVCAELTQ